MERDLLGGVWATVLLKIIETGEVDLDAIDGQVAAYRAAGCDGIYSNETTAEFHSQTEAQFREISRRTAAAAARHGIPFQIGAAHPLAQGSLERIAFAVALRLSAIQVTLPDWTAIDLAATRRFLAGAAEAAEGVLLVLYNPPHARTVLSPAELHALSQDVPALGGSSAPAVTPGGTERCSRFSRALRCSSPATWGAWVVLEPGLPLPRRRGPVGTTRAHRFVRSD